MCITPMWRNEYQVNVPCGRCPECIRKRVGSWIVRIQKEADVSTSAYFVTLTYSDKYVPIAQGGLTLDKIHLQLFMKRLRKRSLQKLVYIAVGEYGGQFQRPHYHMILFNSSIEAVTKEWIYGAVHFGNVENGSISYCFDYLTKKRLTEEELNGRQKEFMLFSKGIGKCYVEDKRNLKWHKDILEDRYYIPAGGGKKMPMPRYYRDRIYTKEEFGYLKGHLENISNEKQDELNKKYSSYHIAQYHIQQFKKMHSKTDKPSNLDYGKNYIQEQFLQQGKDRR